MKYHNINHVSIILSEMKDQKVYIVMDHYLIYLNFQPLEVVSRDRHPHLKWLKITLIC